MIVMDLLIRIEKDPFMNCQKEKRIHLYIITIRRIIQRMNNITRKKKCILRS